MSTDKPTPLPLLPWYYQEDDFNAYEIKDAFGHDIADNIYIKADAALIVRAVNRGPAYEALLEAAKAISIAPVHEEDWGALNAAIALVEKEGDN